MSNPYGRADEPVDVLGVHSRSSRSCKRESNAKEAGHSVLLRVLSPSGQGKVLRLEIERRFAALYVKRYRMMLMRDHPPAVNLAETDCGTPPHVEFHPLRGYRAHVAE